MKSARFAERRHQVYGRVELLEIRLLQRLVHPKVAAEPYRGSVARFEGFSRIGWEALDERPYRLDDRIERSIGLEFVHGQPLSVEPNMMPEQGRAAA